MAKFKRGDKAVMLQDTGQGLKKGDIIVIDEDSSHIPMVNRVTGGRFCINEAHAEIYYSDNTTKSTFMTSLINKLKLATKSEPEKSFIKLGIMDINEKFTAEGKEIFDNYLYEQHKATFKTDVVDPIIAEDEKEAKK